MLTDDSPAPLRGRYQGKRRFGGAFRATCRGVAVARLRRRLESHRPLATDGQRV
ncbi:MAG TPA: hypothetical protein VM221_12535 [Armatimonadota bacterium]|nr:hypothetical protein [Armatimonadota bacterium]